MPATTRRAFGLTVRKAAGINSIEKRATYSDVLNTPETIPNSAAAPRPKIAKQKTYA